MIRFRFVEDNRADLPVKRMCDLVELPRSSFYAWRNHTPTARDRADAVLLEEIEDIYLRSRRAYGVPRVYGQLRRNGHRVARSRVARLMRANGLVGAHTAKKWRRGRPEAGGVPDLLNRQFNASAPSPTGAKLRHRNSARLPGSGRREPEASAQQGHIASV